MYQNTHLCIKSSWFKANRCNRANSDNQLIWIQNIPPLLFDGVLLCVVPTSTTTLVASKWSGWRPRLDATCIGPLLHSQPQYYYRSSSSHTTALFIQCVCVSYVYIAPSPYKYMFVYGSSEKTMSLNKIVGSTNQI